MWARLHRYQFRRTSIVSVFCTSLLAGIGLAHSGRLVTSAWWWLCLVPAIFLLRRRSLWTFMWVLFFGLSLGWWRGSVYMQELANYTTYYNAKVTITAVASGDAVYNKYKQMSFDAREVTIVDTGQQLKGKISLGGFGLNAVFAGDTIRATGTLKSSLGSYQGRMSFAQLELVAHHNSIIKELRRRFTAAVQSTLPEPLASFGMGLLIGQRNTLPQEISQSLLMVGLTHIIAVSGYNLTILLQAANKTSGKRSKRLATLFAIGLIGLFLTFAGASASIVRAAIISLLSIAAGYYGRQFKPLVLILLGAAITGFASPFYIWSDISWYLSFLAFFGVMFLAPLLSRNWPSRLKESLVIGVAMESICAEIMTLPIILHVFGQMSLIGLLANVLVVALIPLAMLLTLIAGLAGMLLPTLAGWLAWPARLLMTYMLDVALMLSRIPHIFVQNLGFSLLQMVLAYVLIGMFTVLLHFKLKSEKRIITDNKTIAQGENHRYVRSQQMVNNQA